MAELSVLPDTARQQGLLIKEGIAVATRNAIFWPSTVIEKEHVRIRPNFDTACWNWRPHFHSIYIGADILDKSKNSLMKPDLSDAQCVSYIGLFYTHEKGHAFYTHKDLRAVQKLLNQLGSVFQVFNLLEDARIEHLLRTLNKRQMNWLDFEVQSFKADPCTWLFSMIQCQGDEALIAKYLEDLKRILPQTEQENLDARFARVKWYYDTVRAMATYLQVAMLSKSWIAEFGKPENPDSQGSGGTGAGKFDSELQEMASLQGTPAIQSLIDEDCDNYEMALTASPPKDSSDQSDAEGAKSEEDEEEASALSSSPQAVKAEAFLDASRPFVDVVAAERCANLLAKVLAPRRSKISTSEPSRKLNMKAMGKGRLEFLHSVQISRKGKRSLCLIVDCSSSMNGIHIQEAKVIILAMSLLAKRGMIEGTVILSKIRSGGPAHAKLTLPISEDIIARIGATGGGEGLESALKTYFRELRDADFSWTFTDGHITDTPVDKQYFYRRGLELIGIYACEQDTSRKSLEKHFHKVIVRNNAFDILKYLLCDL